MATKDYALKKGSGQSYNIKKINPADRYVAYASDI